MLEIEEKEKKERKRGPKPGTTKVSPRLHYLLFSNPRNALFTSDVKVKFIYGSRMYFWNKLSASCRVTPSSNKSGRPS